MERITKLTTERNELVLMIKSIIMRSKHFRRRGTGRRTIVNKMDVFVKPLEGTVSCSENEN